MPIKIETPPTLTGQSDNQIRQLASYLYKLSENLNIALNSIEYVNNSKEDGQTSAAFQTDAKGNIVINEQTGTTYNELRALIGNTADYVRVTEQKLKKEMSSNYQAISNDFGTFTENIGATITATAREVVSSYNYDSRITALDAAAAGFSEYKTLTEGFIRQGFIDYDQYGAPIIGIAIGQDLTSTEVTIEGEKYQQFDRTQSCAFYTADRVSFRLNGEEVAYLSNRKLYIGDADITGTLTFAGDWLISNSNGFTIKYIG